jgi:ATP-dependent Clp protease ATP-binding subunit ClpA
MTNQPDRVNFAIERAVKKAKSLTHEYVTIEHLLYSMLEEDDVLHLVGKMQVDVRAISKEIEDFLQSRDDISVENGSEPRKTLALDRIFNRAVTQAIFSGSKQLVCRDIFISILSEKSSTAYYILKKYGVSRSKAIEILQNEHNAAAGLPTNQTRSGQQQNSSQIRFEDYAINLNIEASEGRIDPIVGRTEELTEVAEILARRKKNNVIIVGEPGVGKTAIAEGLALMITEGTVPHTLENKTVYSLDVTSMVAGTKYRGEFEERAKEVFEQLAEKDNTILFIDEIHMIMGAGNAGGSNIDIANLLKPLLASGRLNCIGATTSEEYRENFEKDRALQRRFQRMNLNPPSNKDTKLILRGLREYYETFHEVSYEDDALDLAVDLAERYIFSKYNPDRAIDVMDVAGAQAKLHKTTKTIGKHEIEKAISKIANIPLDMIDAKQNTNYANLENNIKSKLFGQDLAVEQLTEAIFVAKSGMRPTNKPIGSFLFVGPTGTGKTELCRQLAKNLDVKLRKYDMSEYMESHSVSKLIGAPPGYVGHAEGGIGSGKLINDVEETPNCIVLLDEVEKAHPSVMNLLLQVMDDGRLTSSTGKTADFSNVILIMTSNLGASQRSKQAIGFSNDNNDASKVAIEKFFSPEFRNRLDAVVEFKNLEKQHIDLIVDKIMAEINEMLKDKMVRISLTPASREWLRDKGYVPNMGARPLSRVINDNIKKPISKEILFGKLMNGGNVEVHVTDGELSFVYH